MKKYEPLSEEEIRRLLYSEQPKEPTDKFDFGPKESEKPKEFIKVDKRAYLANYLDELEETKNKIGAIPAKGAQHIGTKTKEYAKAEVPILKSLLVFFIVIFLVSTATIWPGIGSQLAWWYKTELRPPKQENAGIVVSKPKPATPPTTPVSETKPAVTYTGPKNRLTIVKIGVDAPVVWQVPENQIIDRLHDGVVNIANSGRPDQKPSNTAIIGHSSYFSWDRGLYKTVFALLDKVAAGDKITLSDDNHLYTYQVKNISVVKPNDVSILNLTNDRLITLITCTPVGTALNRLIVQGVLIEVDYQPVS